jgi:hypothetical protein
VRASRQQLPSVSSAEVGKTQRSFESPPSSGCRLVNRCCQVHHKARHSIRWRRAACYSCHVTRMSRARAKTPWSQLASLRHESAGFCRRGNGVGWDIHAEAFAESMHVKTGRLTSFHPVTETRILSCFCQIARSAGLKQRELYEHESCQDSGKGYNYS